MNTKQCNESPVESVGIKGAEKRGAKQKQSKTELDSVLKSYASPEGGGALGHSLLTSCLQEYFGPKTPRDKDGLELANCKYCNIKISAMHKNWPVGDECEDCFMARERGDTYPLFVFEQEHADKETTLDGVL